MADAVGGTLYVLGFCSDTLLFLLEIHVQQRPAKDTDHEHEGDDPGTVEHFWPVELIQAVAGIGQSIPGGVQEIIRGGGAAAA